MLKAITPVRLLKNPFYEQVLQAESKCATKEELLKLLGRARSKKGMFEGDLKEGELEIGQISGLVREILPAKVIVEQIWAEYSALLKDPLRK